MTNNSIINDCDNSRFWQTLVVKATNLGIIHAETSTAKPLTANQLFTLLQENMGGIKARNGHISALRSAYGAAYKGIKLTRRAIAVARLKAATNP